MDNARALAAISELSKTLEVARRRIFDNLSTLSLQEYELKKRMDILSKDLSDHVKKTCELLKNLDELSAEINEFASTRLFESDERMFIKIEELGLSIRALNALKRSGADIKCVCDIISNWEELPKYRNLGPRCLSEIEDKIRQIDIDMPPHRPIQY